MCCVSSFVTNLAFPSFFHPLKSTLEGVALTAAAAMGADVDAAGSILLPLLLSSVSQQALLLSRTERGSGRFPNVNCRISEETIFEFLFFFFFVHRGQPKRRFRS